MIVEILFGCVPAAVAIPRSERGESGCERLEHAWTEGQKVELALARDVDQPRGFQFLDVVRKGGGSNRQGRTHLRTAKRARRLRDSLQQFKALGVGEGLENGGALGARQALGFG